MNVAAKIVIALIALIHLYIMWLEMFGWMTTARKIFKKFPPELFAPTQPMAANQGLYNGFLAAGLVWGTVYPDPEGRHILTFFLLCVAIAGAYGGYSVSRRIFWIQGFPALLALGLLWISGVQEQLL